MPRRTSHNSRNITGPPQQTFQVPDAIRHTAVPRWRNCQVPARGRHPRYCFSEKKIIGIGTLTTGGGSLREYSRWCSPTCIAFMRQVAYQFRWGSRIRLLCNHKRFNRGIDWAPARALPRPPHTNSHRNGYTVFAGPVEAKPSLPVGDVANSRRRRGWAKRERPGQRIPCRPAPLPLPRPR